MVYYLGRDVKVYITTESDEAQVDVSSNEVSAISAGGASVAATAAGTYFIHYQLPTAFAFSIAHLFPSQ